MIRYITAIGITIYVIISLYLGYGSGISDNTWFTLAQLNECIAWLIITMWLPSWFKIAAFAILALCFVELMQELTNDNSQLHISDKVALIVVICSVIGFILVRRQKRLL